MAHIMIFKPFPLAYPVELVYGATVWVPLDRRGSEMSLGVGCLPESV